MTVFIGFLLYGLYYCWVAFPIATGYGAKVLCSSVFVSGRSESDIKSEDLDFMPLTFASYKVNFQDSSVTCSMFGFAVKKAIYRKRFGATLVNGISEEDIRMQQFPLPMLPRVQTDSVLWPMGDKLIDRFPSGIDSLQVLSAVDKIFNKREEAFTNLTRALIVVYENQIVAERYAPGFSSQTRLTGWSMTKSIMGALAGILVKQHKLDIAQPAPVPEWKNVNDQRHSITVSQLLQHTSGLNFDEVYDKPSHANKMLFREGNTAAFAASQSLKRTPGENFRYSSGNSNILSRIYRQVIGEHGYHAFPYEELFYKVGMYNTILEPDASGTFVGSSFCFATARDWARFGLLYLNNGQCNNQQIFPVDWVRQSTTPSSAAKQGEYGFQWWLNAGEGNNINNRLFPELPADMYFADGYEGQNIYIIPSKKLMVVRLGLTRNRLWGENGLIKSLIKALRD
ncbi:MAG: serine hydrolase [Chitinophagaceae bacterium]